MPALYAHYYPADRLQHLYDYGLVLAPALSRRAAVPGHSHQLGACAVRILPGVPANRYGSYVYSAALHEGITWNQVIGFALIASGAFFVFRAPI